MLIDEIKKIANAFYSDVIAYRRHLHANPELSFREYQTSAFIKAHLTEMKVEWKLVIETGVVAIIAGEKPSEKVIALRADMDGLPIIKHNQ